MKAQLWSDSIAESLRDNEEHQRKSLLLAPDPNYPAYLLVDSFDPLFEERLSAVLTDLGNIHILKIDQLYDEAARYGFENVFFTKDAVDLQAKYANLNRSYPCELNVDLLRFQLQGFNYTKDEPTAIINWSTGTGKSVYAVARAKYLLESKKISKVMVVSKNHNKFNWQKTFLEIGGLEAAIDESVSGSDADSKRTARASQYKENTINIINYEKLRMKGPTISGDGQELMTALKGHRVLWIWDEMPSKIKKIGTAHFKGASKILKKCKYNYQIMLSATPIETDPENLYVCMKLLDPTIWSNIESFRRQYAKSFSTFSPWQVATWDKKRLGEMSMRIAHITHQANKYRDPEIRAQFPEEHWENILIDMSDDDRRLYDIALQDVIANVTDYSSLFTKINVLQMICNNPAILNQSSGAFAKLLVSNYTFDDTHSAKLTKLRELLNEIDSKIVLFSMYNDFGAKMLMTYLIKWGHTFVLYEGSPKKKSEALARFKENDGIKIFLSSDQGSDSINLEEATTVINYDLPWNYSTLEQRVNRINRITSEADHVFYYNLTMANTIEERKLKILDRKKGYHSAIFDGDIGDQGEILANITQHDLLWLLGQTV